MLTPTGRGVPSHFTAVRGEIRMARTPPLPQTPAASDGRGPARERIDSAPVDSDAPTTRLPPVHPPPPADSASDGTGDRPTLTQAAQTQAAPAIPERPTLAPGVQLRGQMQESAFKDP